MLRRFFSYYAPYKGLFFLDFGCAILAGLLELSFPMAVKLFIDKLLPNQDWVMIVWAAAGLLLIYLLNTVLMAIVNYWGHALGVGIETDMRRQAFNHLQKLSFSYYDNIKTGHIITHVTKDLEEVGEVAHHGPEDLFIAVMTFIGAFILMATVHLPLAMVTIIIVPFMTYLVTRYGSKMTDTWRKLFGQVGNFNTRIEESIGGIRVVKAFANEPHEEKLFAKDNENYRDDQATSLSDNDHQHDHELSQHPFGAIDRDGRWHLVCNSRPTELRRLCRFSALSRSILPPCRENNFSTGKLP